jgi:cytochrome o ubiquinol oxidase subunit IV
VADGSAKTGTEPLIPSFSRHGHEAHRLAVLAIAQMGVHLVFFLHITTGPDSTHNVLALAFGVLIVFLILAGSLVIMANLNENMMAHGEMMNLQMQR